jgi:hypothetical protein
MTTLAERPPLARIALISSIGITGVLAVFSTAPLVVALSGACLFAMIFLLWRGDEPPILLLPVLFQWSEVALVPISTVWKQVPLNSLSTYGADLQESAIYGLIGVLLLAVGLRAGAGTSKRVPQTRRLIEEVRILEFDQIARLCLMAIGVGYAAAIVRPFAGGAAELVHQIGSVKQAGLFVLTFWCLSRKSHLWLLTGVVVFEMVSGLTGFFAEFKDSVLTFLVATLAARPRIRLSDVLIVGIATGLLLTIAVFWSEIKPGYREFLNRGTGAQEVAVSVPERLQYLSKSAQSMDAEGFAEGFDRLVLRHGYIEFLGLTLQNVPERIPHEGGNLTSEVLQHIVMPRVLFPEKPPLPDDTEIMSKYTGLPDVWTSDTSISLGYLGELYVDFGYFGGLLACLVIGWIFGRICAALRSDERSSALVSGGLTMMVALTLAYFGTAYVKLVAGGVFCAIIAFGTQRLVLPIIFPGILRMHGKRPSVSTLEP